MGTSKNSINPGSRPSVYALTLRRNDANIRGLRHCDGYGGYARRRRGHSGVAFSWRPSSTEQPL
jgi:hypothetical protein